MWRSPSPHVWGNRSQVLFYKEQEVVTIDICHNAAELSSGEAEELQRIKWHREQLLEDIQVCREETEEGSSRKQDGGP
uniref:Uncharacterized protein n=1 Tax=Spermophilus dauricus TaxID=99837 RepID=A0A8C9QVW2_SPEDA